MSSGEANLCPEIFFLTSNLYLSHLPSSVVTKLDLPLNTFDDISMYVIIIWYSPADAVGHAPVFS